MSVSLAKPANAIVILPDWTVYSVNLDLAGDVLRDLYHTIGCDTVDVVSVPGFDAYVDDEGLYNQVPNLLATAFLTFVRGQHYQTYHGPVVLLGGVDDDGETRGLSASRVDITLRYLAALGEDLIARNPLFG